MARSRMYRNGVAVAGDFPLTDLGRVAAEPDATVWLDLCAPTPADLAAVGDELGIHELAVEGAAAANQRPKLDRYDGHLFLNAYAVQLDTADGKLVTSEVAAFVTANVLVTVRKDEMFPMSAVVARWDASADLAKLGV